MCLNIFICHFFSLPPLLCVLVPLFFNSNLCVLEGRNGATLLLHDAICIGAIRHGWSDPPRLVPPLDRIPSDCESSPRVSDLNSNVRRAAEILLYYSPSFSPGTKIISFWLIDVWGRGSSPAHTIQHELLSVQSILSPGRSDDYSDSSNWFCSSKKPRLHMVPPPRLWAPPAQRCRL